MKSRHDLGAGRAAGIIVADLREAVAGAMAHVRGDVAGPTTDLVAEKVRDGGQAVKRAIQLEAGAVRAALGAIIGNAGGPG